MNNPTPTRVYTDSDTTIWSGDARDVLASLPTASVDMLCTDPPYGLSSPPDIDEVLKHWDAGDDYVHHSTGFMSAAWDSFVPGPAVWREALRVCKPGAPALVFAGSRTIDLMMASMRRAGWIIAGTMHYRFGSGFPKAMDIAKALDRAGGVASHEQTHEGSPATSLAARWQGWKTQLKVAHEPMVVAYAPGPARIIPVVHPYTPKAPNEERVTAFLPGCECHGDPHELGADSTIAQFKASRCALCGAPYAEYRHPTVKPLAAMRALVRSVPAGAVILDPFVGTGTTAVAAAEEGRRSVVVDASPVHASMAARRVEAVQPVLFSLEIA